MLLELLILGERREDVRLSEGETNTLVLVIEAADKVFDLYTLSLLPSSTCSATLPRRPRAWRQILCLLHAAILQVVARGISQGRGEADLSLAVPGLPIL